MFRVYAKRWTSRVARSTYSSVTQGSNAWFQRHTRSFTACGVWRQQPREVYPRWSLTPEQGQWATVNDIVKYDAVLQKGEKASQVFTLTGRIRSKRESSAKLIFYDVVQDGQTIQVLASRGRFEGSPDQFAAANRELCRGDIVSFTGVPGKTNHGQLSMFVTQGMKVLTPCLRDIPRSGLKDPEKRFRQRHLDMLVNPESVEILRTRTKIIRFIRQFLDQRGFYEVETPVLSATAGGANARPFMTHAHALGMDMQLRIAPELYLKQLVIGGMDRVYEIGKQFRNEGIDADHNPEFTTCEFYQAYGNLESLFKDTETMVSELVRHIRGSTTLTLDGGKSVDFSPPFRRINVLEYLEAKLNVSLDNLETQEAPQRLLELCKQHRIHVTGAITTSRILDKLISHFIEPQCTQPTFLFGHPLALSPLAKSAVDEKGRLVAARFELFVDGKEIVNAYEELNEPKEQRLRFEQQVRDRQQGDLEAPIPDMAFCDALEYGLPPTAGWGMGIDRVVQLLTGTNHIREVLAFPIMRPLSTENDSSST
ncbi:lysyl-tRNA synthetase [Radiomyces spectabilis]|uniref:lysyl-tRNA synthetase n=1 Tax=Radiomyces spectabilis TaxID=64574 RepID=UPI00221F9311|nr:lysyl-tRNA synthetase [Radiomyces spectabilis]KAI8370478.1 lysyl-tRNA synthetase [Radiomyces spectabilis]